MSDVAAEADIILYLLYSVKEPSSSLVYFLLVYNVLVQSVWSV